MVRIRFTGTEREYTVRNPKNIPAVIKKEAKKQGWPDSFGMEIIGESAADCLKDFEMGFPCQINIYYFNGIPYEGSSVGDSSAICLTKIKNYKTNEPVLPCYY